MTEPVNLLDLVSWEVADVLDYLAQLDLKLSDNALLKRFGRSLDDVRIELKAIPFDVQAEAEEVQEREHFRRVVRRRDGGNPQDEPADRGERERRIYGARGRPQTAQPQPLDRILAPLRSAVILGDPGGGKTEFLQDCARTAARTAMATLRSAAKPFAEVALPVFLHLRDLAAELGDEKGLQDCLGRFGMTAAAPLADPLRVPVAIVQALSRPDPRWSPRLARVLWRRLIARPGHVGAVALVCLDAWDELRKGHVDIAKYLGAYVASTGAKVLVTSRIAGYVERGPPFPTDDAGRAALRICPFERPDTEAFIAHFFSRSWREQEIGQRLASELRNKVPVSGMAENPLLATLLCMAYWPDPRKKPLALPVRRGELYYRILRGLLGHWPDQVVIKEEIDGGLWRTGLIAPKLAMITALAHRFFPAQLLADTDVHEFLWGESGYFAERGPAASPSHPLQRLMLSSGLDIEKLLCEDGVLTRVGSDGFAFLHLTFQEFLTARALAARPWEEIERLIDRKSWLAAWEEVVILLAGQLTDPGRLLDLLADPDKDDFLRHRTILAALALPEMSKAEREANEERITRITTTLVDRFFELAQRRSVRRSELEEFCGRPLPTLAIANGNYHDGPLLKWLEKNVTKARDRKSAAPRAGNGRQHHYLQLFESAHRDSRAFHVQCLGRFGPAAATPGILATLRYLLTDDVPFVRSAAAYAMVELGPATATPEILAAVRRLLTDDDPIVRSAAGRAVGALGAAAVSPDFMTSLGYRLTNNDHEFGSAVAVIGRLGKAAATHDFLATLGRLLGDDNPRLRSSAVEAIGALGTAAATTEFLAALRHMLADDRPFVRRAAADAVGKVGTAAATPDLLAALRPQLVVGDYFVRRAAADAVGKLGSDAATPEILGVLGNLLSDDDHLLRKAAAEAAGALGTVAATSKIVTALGHLLTDDYAEVRYAAAEAICGYGAAAETSEILAALGHLLADDDGLVRRAAPRAIAAQGAAAVTPDFQATLQDLSADYNPQTRSAVAEAIGRLGPGAVSPGVLAALRHLLADDDRLVRFTAAEAVGRLGPAAAATEILAALRNLLVDAHDFVRTTAAKAVGELGTAAATPEILTAIRFLLADDNHGGGSAAVEALGRMGPAAATPGILADLRRLIANGESYAADAAGRLGSAAATPAILGALQGLLVRTDVYFDRGAAVEALGRFGVSPVASLSAGLDELQSKVTDKTEFQEQASEILVSLPDLRAFERKSGWTVRSVHDLGSDISA